MGSHKNVPSHLVIDNYIKTHGEDLRFEVAPHPIEALRDRKTDNYEIARVKGK